MNFSDKIKFQREQNHLTQKELAERTGINQADISKLENGTRNPSVNLLKRLAEGMGMSLKIAFVPKQNVWSNKVIGLASSGDFLNENPNSPAMACF